MSYRRRTWDPPITVIIPTTAAGGYLIVVNPATQQAGLELQAAPDNGSGAVDATRAETIAVLAAGRPWYLWEQPLDGLKRFFRARHAGRGKQASDYTPWTVGRAPYEWENGTGEPDDRGREDFQRIMMRVGLLTNTILGQQHDQTIGGHPAAVFLGLFATGYGQHIPNQAGPVDAYVVDTTGGSWVSGPAGGAYDVNNSAIITATDPDGGFKSAALTDFTIDAIVRVDDTAQLNYVVRVAGSYYVRFSAAGRLEVATYDGGTGARTFTTFDLDDFNLEGVWFHLKVKYDASLHPSASLFAYLNGRLIESQPRVTGSPVSQGDDLEIGHQANGTSHLNGALAYLRVAVGQLLDDFPFLHQLTGELVHKHDRVAPSRFVARLDTVGIDLEPDGAYIQPLDVSTSRTVIAHVNVPEGAVITGVDAELFRGTATDVVDVRLKKVPGGTGTVTTVATLAADTNGWQIKSNLALSEQVGGGQESWVLVGTLNPDATKTNTLIGHCNVYYDDFSLAQPNQV